MDVFVMDDSFQKTALYDKEAYISLVWTERYADPGDITLEVPDTPANRVQLPEGAFLSISSSREVMMIETRNAEDGVLKLTGPSLIDFFKQRPLKRSWDNKYGFCSIFNKQGLIPGDIVRQFLMPTAGGIAQSNAASAFGYLDIIPGLIVTHELDTQYPTMITVPVKHGTVYAALKEFIDTYDWGFTVLLTDPANKKLEYRTYEGKDRTSRQTTNAVVRFTPALDSLADPKELHSIQGYKTVAYAYAPNVVSTASYIGYAAVTSQEYWRQGFKRRTLQVLADDIQPADVDLTTTAGQNAFKDLLNLRAASGLANNNYVRMVDGELVPQEMYKYNRDYSLGDVIELGVNSGDSSYARITEYIRTVDTSGYKEYPTLSVLGS